jgi:hypothetical protein
MGIICVRIRDSLSYLSLESIKNVFIGIFLRLTIKINIYYRSLVIFLRDLRHIFIESFNEL